MMEKIRRATQQGEDENSGEIRQVRCDENSVLSQKFSSALWLEL